MKASIYLIALLLLCITVSACASTPTPDVEATEQAALAATQAAQPTDTPVPPTDTPVPSTNTPTPTDTPVPPTDTPTPTDTPVPPTDTPTPTDTPIPPTDTPAPPTDTPTPAATATPTVTAPPPPTATPDIGASPLDVTWSEQMNYEGNVGESQWCQINMTYTNNSTQNSVWPEYQPAFLIVNADGSAFQWRPGNYYHKSQGWPTGIEGTPPDILAGGSAEWTWYTATDQAGQYCSIVGVAVQDWLYVAHYDAEGKLAETEIIPPQ